MKWKCRCGASENSFLVQSLNGLVFLICLKAPNGALHKRNHRFSVHRQSSPPRCAPTQGPEWLSIHGACSSQKSALLWQKPSRSRSLLCISNHHSRRNSGFEGRALGKPRQNRIELKLAQTLLVEWRARSRQGHRVPDPLLQQRIAQFLGTICSSREWQRQAPTWSAASADR
jgi:hypothetical protein